MGSVALLGPAGIVALALAAAALLLGTVWFLLPYTSAGRRCAACGAEVARRDEACPVCGRGAPLPSAHPGAAPYGFPSATRGALEQPRIEDGMAYNRRITRRVVTLATGAMGLGVGVRVVGMLGVLGLPAVPAFLDGLLTIVGGLVAFVGFVFLDAA
jgi:hypothetical protein